MREHVLFFLNGIETRVSGADAWLTVTDFLRKSRGLYGTKVVCAEGDCGACSVLLGSPDGDKIDYRPVTACIFFVFQLDGRHLVTIEAFGDDKALTPLEESMAACHAAQCGFCTPGFVVTLHELLTRDDAPATRESITRGCVGNLCRCTGYDAIIRAALATDRGSLRSLDMMFDPRAIAAALSECNTHDVRISDGERIVFRPLTIDGVLTALAEIPQVVLVAGATDVGVRVNKRVQVLGDVVSLNNVAALNRIDITKDQLTFGTGVSLTVVEEVTRDALPELADFLQWFGSPQIKNSGTVGGNLASGSPIADTVPAWLVLNASVGLASSLETRRVALADFVIGYRQTVLRPDELIVDLRCERLKAGEKLKLYKISRRKDLDISTVSLAFRLRLEGSLVASAMIAIGGVGATVVRAVEAERQLSGKPLKIEHFERAGEIAANGVTPLSDVRGSAAYRQTLVKNAFVKLFHDLTVET